MTDRPGVEIDETGHVRVTDPHGLRVLAHPARQAAIDRLYDGEVLTATQLAEACGLTPSAMSYHLRALERWGLVLRDASDDARERPWRAAGRALSVTPTAIASSEYAQAAEFMRVFVAPLSEHVTRVARRMTEAHERGEDLAGLDASAHLSRSRVRLTKEEFEQVSREITALVESYRREAPEERPEGSVDYDVYLSILPHDLDDAGPA